MRVVTGAETPFISKEVVTAHFGDEVGHQVWGIMKAPKQEKWKLVSELPEGMAEWCCIEEPAPPPAPLKKRKRARGVLSCEMKVGGAASKKSKNGRVQVLCFLP
jgi:hypothetical protein